MLAKEQNQCILESKNGFQQEDEKERLKWQDLILVSILEELAFKREKELGEIRDKIEQLEYQPPCLGGAEYQKAKMNWEDKIV